MITDFLLNLQPLLALEKSKSFRLNIAKASYKYLIDWYSRLKA